MSMTKEQEAVEIVEKIVKSYIEADECGLSNNDFKHEIRALQTVLSMLKEKDEHIKELELEKINNAESICLAQNKMLSYFNGYEDGKNARGSAIQRIIDRQKDYIYERQIEKCKNIIDKKDRIIDEMAEKLNQAYCDENDYWDWFEERFGRIPDGSYAKKIKQYFKRKVEE